MKRLMKPVHPGAIFREDILKPLEITLTEAAKALEVSRKQLSELVNERAAFSPEMSVRIQQVFGVSAEFWLDLQKKYDVFKIQNSGKIHLKKFKRAKTAA